MLFRHKLTIFFDLFRGVRILDRFAFSIRITLTGEAIGETFADCGASDPHIFVFIQPTAKLLRHNELHRFDARRHTEHVYQHNKDAEGELVVGSPHIVDAIRVLRCTIRLLAARFSTVHASLKTEFHGVVEFALVDPILLANLDRVLG